MSHFYGELQGSRGSISRGGDRSSGIRAHIRGWNIGCRVKCYVNGDGIDEIAIYKTRGSHNEASEELVAVIQEEKESSKECN